MGVTLRSFIIGLLAVAAVSWTVTYAECILASIQIGFLQLPPAVLGFLVILILFNRLSGRLSHRLSLSNAEIITIYSMMLMAAMISSRGLMQKVMPVMIATNYYANPGNDWQTLFYPYIRKWMVAYNPEGAPMQDVAVRYYERLRAGESIPWDFWALPLFMWGILAMLIFGAFLCLANILRKQWVDNEKLSFPLAQLPLDMIKQEGHTPLFANKLTWIGFAIPAIIFGFNGLHNISPSVPSFTLEQNLTAFLPPTSPWNAIYMTIGYLSFAAIGLFYLLPADILFSLWFFFLYMRFQSYIAGVAGANLEVMPIYPCYKFMGYQAMGAYFVLVAYMLYTGWPHFKKVAANAFGKKTIDDSSEMLSYSQSFWGLIICLALAIAWLSATGMDVWLAAFELLVMVFIVGLVLARSVSEGGLLMTETSFRPIDIIRLVAAPQSLGAQNLTSMAFVDTAFLRDQRGLLLSGFLDALKISDGVSLKRRVFFPLFIVSIISAALFAGYLQLYYPYVAKGALNMYSYPYTDNAQWAFADYQQHVHAALNPTDGGGGDPGMAANRIWMLVGLGTATFLAWMRLAFFWWPLHPLGFALAPSWTMFNFWFPCFLAWMFKSLILRYGGMMLYTRMRPLFLGLILGEFLSALFWTMVSAMSGAPPPRFPWP